MEEPTKQEVIGFMRSKHPELVDQPDQDIYGFAQHKYPDLFGSPTGGPTIGPAPGWWSRFTSEIGRQLIPEGAQWSDLYTGPAYVAQHPLDTAGLLLHAGAQGAELQKQRAQEEFSQGNVVPGILHGAMGAIPFAGPALGSFYNTMREQGVTSPESAAQFMTIVAPELISLGTDALSKTARMAKYTELTKAGQTEKWVGKFLEESTPSGRTAPTDQLTAGTRASKKIQEVGDLVEQEAREAAKPTITQDPKTWKANMTAAEAEKVTVAAGKKARVDFENAAYTKAFLNTLDKNPAGAYRLLRTKQMTPERLDLIQKIIGKQNYRAMVAQNLNDFFADFTNPTTPTGYRQPVLQALEKPEGKWSNLKNMMDPAEYAKLKDIAKYASDPGTMARFFRTAERYAGAETAAGAVLGGAAGGLSGGVEGAAIGVGSAVLARVASRTEGMTVLQGLFRALARNDERRIVFYGNRLGEYTRREFGVAATKQPQQRRTNLPLPLPPPG